MFTTLINLMVLFNESCKFLEACEVCRTSIFERRHQTRGPDAATAQLISPQLISGRRRAHRGPSRPIYERKGEE